MTDKLNAAARRAALAEPEQEPVAWMVYTLDGQSVCVTDNPADFADEHRALPLYTAPPKAEPVQEPLVWEPVARGLPALTQRQYDALHENLRWNYARVSSQPEPVQNCWFEDRNGALRNRPEDCVAFSASGQPAAVWVGKVRYTPPSMAADTAPPQREPEQAQEPVASDGRIVIEWRDGVPYLNGQEIDPGTLEIRRDGATYRAAERVAVQPEPAQRPPLTDEEILSVLRLAPPEPSLWPHLKDEAVVGDVQRAVLAIARAVERKVRGETE